MFFAIECGNRYLSKNTIRLDEDAPDGPRADIAAIVLAAAIANLVVSFGLKHADALTIQGNEYAMVSPLFELPLYMGLGLVCGAIAVTFTKLRDFFTEQFRTLSAVPKYLHPLFGGLLCGSVAVFYPQTLFVGYFILDQLLAGKIQLGLALLLQLLGLKLLLTSFALGSGLIGGVFAPSLFFGTVAGSAYHAVISSALQWVSEALATSYSLPLSVATSSVVDSFAQGLPSGPTTASSMVHTLSGSEA